jgi:hypothetical protein
MLIFQDLSLFVSSCSLGNNVVVATQPRVTPPGRYWTAFLLPLAMSPSLPTEESYSHCATSGMMIPNKLPQKLVIPHAPAAHPFELLSTCARLMEPDTALQGEHRQSWGVPVYVRRVSEVDRF